MLSRLLRPYILVIQLPKDLLVWRLSHQPTLAKGFAAYETINVLSRLTRQPSLVKTHESHETMELGLWDNEARRLNLSSRLTFQLALAKGLMRQRDSHLGSPALAKGPSARETRRHQEFNELYPRGQGAESRGLLNY
jgi:hypothetical protein